MSPESLLLCLWVLRLFKPEWLISFYVPGTTFLRGVPTLVLYGLLVYALVIGKRIQVHKPIFVYLGSIALSTTVAYNTGLARGIFFGMLDTAIFFSINLMLVTTDRQIRTILNLYMGAFAFYAVWGITHNGRVLFHNALADEDGFGPFMDLGVGLCAFLVLKDGKQNYRPIIAGLFSVLGLIASFARGAFLSLCGTVVFVWLHSPRKILAGVVGVVVGIFFVVAASVMFGGAKYWEEMASINESLVDKKKEGRHYLAEKAVQLFLLHPILGTGPRCYGPALSKTISAYEADVNTGYRLDQLYVRVPHNIYLQLLAEQGLVGGCTFLSMIGLFWFHNRKIQKYYEGRVRTYGAKNVSPVLREHYFISLALNGAMLAYLMNGFFYDILYDPWPLDFILLGGLLKNQFAQQMLSEPTEEPAPVGWRIAKATTTKRGRGIVDLADTR